MKTNIQKKIKVIDSVFFNGEIDYLLFRFTELNDSVDTFIVMESSVDFSGNQKSSYFDENLDKFEKWKDKIIYIKSDFPSELEIKNIFEFEFEDFELLGYEPHPHIPAKVAI